MATDYLHGVYSTIRASDKGGTNNMDASTLAAALKLCAKRINANIAPEYDSTSTYDVGDIVYYDGTLYECTSAITTPEAWNEARWVQRTVEYYLKKIDAEYPRFGVSGVGGSAAKLTRLWDSVGLTEPTPGTDTTPCSSAFDAYAPFNRKKCVGNWVLDTASASPKAKFNVRAYYGDADYAEDGSMGDYVAVEIEPFYYFESGDMLGVSEHQFPGWHIHPVCVDYDGNVRQKTYIPCYAMGLKDGHAVSLPGYQNETGDYKGLWTFAQTYNNEDVQQFAMLEPSAVDHYEWLLFTIEYATQNCQSIMSGCSNIRYSEDKITAVPTANQIVLSGNLVSSFMVGATLYIGSGLWNAEHPSSYNYITAVELCDADGSPSTSGTYTLITYDGTDRSDSITLNKTIACMKPWIPGATDGWAGMNPVKGHTGAPVNLTNSRYPMRYRWRENVYANQYMTSHDLANVRVDNGDGTYHLEWYYNADPRKITKPYNYGLSDLTETKGWVKLGTETPTAEYKNGYVKELGKDVNYPFVHVPVATGASDTTYYCDYAYLVNSGAVRCVRRRGALGIGAYDGFRYFSAYYAPSTAYWHYGAQLYFIQ